MNIFVNEEFIEYPYDYEICKENDDWWVKYAKDIDRSLHGGSFRLRLDPDAYLSANIDSLLNGMNKKHCKILDVGAGPMTTLGKKTDKDYTFDITAVDPFAKYYNHMLDDYSLEPPIRTQFGFAESLCLQFEDESFDLVYSENGIDHFGDPAYALRSMFKCVRPGGYLLINVYVAEGLLSGYDICHQWNVGMLDGAPVLWSNDSPPTFLTSILGVTTCRHQNRADIHPRSLVLLFDKPLKEEVEEKDND